MSRYYISELKTALELVEKRISELEDKAYEGAHSPRFLARDKEEAKKLLERRRELRHQIMFHKP